MKITNVETYAVWGGFRNFLFVVVDTDAGISGVGEAGITGRELAVVGAIEHFKPLLIGQDPFRTEHLWQVLFRGGFFPAQRIIASAISAIDIALWDIKGKALGVPMSWSSRACKPKPRAGSSCAGGCRRRASCWSHARRCRRPSGSSRPCARPSATRSS